MSNWTIEKSDELYHYGVKGMKWGVRRYQPYQRTGRRIGMRPAPQNYQRPRQNRGHNLRRVAKGAAIITGGAVAAFGAYNMSKIMRTPQGRVAMSKGSEWVKTKLISARMTAQNTHRVVRTVTRVPRTALKSLPGGKAALVTLGVASTVSDVNSTRQWVQKTHKQGKVTKKDVKDLVKDLANPIPNNIPGLNKKKKKG